MAWTAPMTAVANAIFTASQFNTYVRDNLLETAPAKATTDGSLFVATGANAIAQRTPAMAESTTSGTSNSTSYTATLTGGGTNPSVTVTTGTSALVSLEVFIQAGNASDTNYVAYAISGATTSSPDDKYSVAHGASASGRAIRASAVHLRTGLTAGSNTFTINYKVAGGAATTTFNHRRITVVPL